MATSAVDRLQRVLDLEERQQWRNRVVIGGLQAMAPRWADDARAEAVEPSMVRLATELMVQYGEGDAGSRAHTAAQLRRVLAGEFVADAPPAPGLPPAPEQPSAGARAMPDARELMNVAPVAPTPRVQPPHAPEAKPAAEASEPQSQRKGDSGAKAAQGKRDNKGGDAGGSISGSSGGADSMVGATFVYEYEGQPGDTPPALKPPSRTSSRPARTADELRKPVTTLQGVGPSIAEVLGRLELHTVLDLLWHLPSRHDDYSQLKTISQLQPGETVTVVANLWEVSEKSIGINRKRIEGIFQDATGTLRANWWNKWVVRQLKAGATYRLSGKIGLYMGRKTIENPIFEDAADESESLAAGRLAPVYPLTEGISLNKMRQLVRQALEDFATLVGDPLPEAVRATYALPNLTDALWGIHFPDDHAQLEAAIKRLTMEELLYVQLGVLQRRRELKSVAAMPFETAPERLAPFVEAMPFALTGAQLRVLDEVAMDLARPVPMTRLVQGDVGSGKTAVAAGAMWLAMGSGAQSALLAPTQILAEQHHRGISRLLAPLQRPDGAPIEVALLTGRVTGSERERILAGLREGAIDVVVGTTALIQEGVEFARLGLVVVDEQHRFGVEQRGALRSQGDTQPHLLVMSATPIPRSLALTVFGDLDISQLDEMPPGRMPVKTVFFRRGERERVYGFVRNEAAAGRQTFIVYPLVADSEVLDAGAATTEYETLRSEVFPDLRLALLHGQMKGSEKDAVMSAFAAGESDVLVSTSVIEVGIDVPNATVMIVEDAERFGLAQLHQFRGRVGRGTAKSYCVLVSAADTEAALERLHVLESTNDGFELAEKDLQLRGPGDFLGTRQSGLPELRIAQFSDLETLALAREAALHIMETDPTLAASPALADQVARFWRGEGDIN